MKASVKLPRDQSGRVQKTPIVKAKLPFDFLGFPVHAGFQACGHIQKLALRLSCAKVESGPSVEIAFRPHEPDRHFTVCFKTGFSPWPSSPASALTMAAEFNLSRLSNPSFMLRLKPELGDFSLCHDFRTAIFGSGSAANTSSTDAPRHGHNQVSSDVSFTNAFARYATKLGLSENSSFPWNDGVRNEIYDTAHRYDAASNANLASFDSTPYASEKASFSMIDLVNFRSEYPTPVRISTEEKRFKDMNQHASASTGWGHMREKMQSRNHADVPRTDDGWEHVDGRASPSITSVSLSTLQSRDGSRPARRRRSHSSSSLAGWVSRGFSGNGHLHACTRLPISPEAHFKIRWSLSVSDSPSLFPLLLLDKVTLEAGALATRTCRTPPLPSLPIASKGDAHPDVAAGVKQVKSLMNLMQREKRVVESSPAYTGSEDEQDQGQEGIDNAKSSKTSLIGWLFHGKGMLD